MDFDKRLEFGRWLREKRKEAGYSQARAALALGYSNPGSMKRIDCGYDGIPIKRLFDFARVYNIPMSELLAKLKELEPDKAAEFELLEKQFSAYFMQMYKTMESEGHSKAGRKGSLHMSNYQTLDNIEHPWHHKPFPSVFSDLDNVFLFTKIYIIRHWNTPFSILSRTLRLFVKIHDITILGNSLPFFVNPLPCLDSPLSIQE